MCHQPWCGAYRYPCTASRHEVSKRELFSGVKLQLLYAPQTTLDNFPTICWLLQRTIMWYKFQGMMSMVHHRSAMIRYSCYTLARFSLYCSIPLLSIPPLTFITAFACIFSLIIFWNISSNVSSVYIASCGVILFCKINKSKVSRSATPREVER